MRSVPTFTGFWAYDLFGYLLPGSLVLAALGKFNRLGHDLIASRWNSGRIQDAALLVGVAYVLGHLVAALSSLVLEKLLLRKVLGYPTSRMFPNPSKPPLGLWRKAGGRVLRFFFPGYFRAYTEQFRAAMDRHFLAAFGFDASDDHDRFWLAWEWVSLHHTVAHRRATHFLDLYGFSRNTSLACFAIAFAPLAPAADCPLAGFPWFLGWGLAALVLFSNYTKLMRRMDDEVYRAFVAASCSPDPAPTRDHTLGSPSAGSE
jgi:hypothetical protein